MHFDVDEATIKRAKFSHELFMLNLALFHLLMTPAALALNIGAEGFLLPLFLSFSVMGLTLWRARAAGARGEWFVMVHARLALRRYRYLLIAYGVTGAVLFLGWMVGQSSADHNMGKILFTVFARIGALPTLLTVLVNFYLESSAIHLAVSREVPEWLVERYPTAGQQSD